MAIVAEGSVLRVLAHPLRLRILSLLTGAPFSAMELSRELSISRAMASYHLRQSTNIALHSFDGAHRYTTAGTKRRGIGHGCGALGAGDRHNF